MRLIDQLEYNDRTLSLYREGDVYHYKVETQSEEVELHLCEYFQDSYEAVMWFWAETEKYIRGHGR